ncbi:MAG: hypothetical protein CSA34_02475 [Desulfobulbus propionicus]|nr:MAG: hypothetical protein CSA34_02475 [Desulfobulbus propionicus]
MNTSELLQLGAKAFRDSSLSGEAGSNLDLQTIISAISGLVGGEGFDLAAIVSKLKAGGLGEIAMSWLGNGTNQGISLDQVKGVFGSEKIDAFAAQLGLNTEEAAGGLSEALPLLIDKASSGGSLLDSFGGVEGVAGLAGKLFNK